MIRWIGNLHGWSIEKDWVIFSPGIVPAVNMAVMAYTQPGDKVIVQPPRGKNAALNLGRLKRGTRKLAVQAAVDLLYPPKRERGEDEADAIARKMTYVELSVSRGFMDEYMSALFLPHTNMDLFPTVKSLYQNRI